MKNAMFAVALAVGVWPTVGAFAHPGGLDANGGHYNRSTGEYHYHSGGGGGGGFSGMGFGGFGSSYTPPPVRVRARTKARTKARGDAKLTAREPAESMTLSVPAASLPDVSEDISSRTTPRSEDRAKELLRLAKLLIAQRKIPGATAYLKELIAKYPSTEAGKEGATLLKGLSSGK